jgi:predicted dehydrogenase
MTSLKIGIVGVGKLGNYHCRALASLGDNNLAGVHDIDQARQAEIANTYRCPAFDSYDDLLNHVDAVGIAVPTTCHLEVAKCALECGKDVFIEKPITTTVAEAEELVDYAEKRGLIIQVGHIERFNPAIRCLEQSQLEPMFIESHRLAPFDPRGTDVAVVLDLMIHDIDIILSLVKSPVKKVDANGVAVVSDEADIANARIQFENGCVANVTASRISQRKMRKMHLFQKESYISIDFLQKLTEVFRLTDEQEETPNTVILGQIEKGRHKRHIIYDRPKPAEEDALVAEWRAFIKAVAEKTRPIVSGRDGLEALKIATIISETISGQTVSM